MDRTEAINEIITYISSIKRALQGRAYRCCDGSSLTGGQVSVLFGIKHFGPINAQDLANKLAFTAGAVSQTIESLLESGLIKRTPRADSRRTFDLALSDIGMQKMAEIEQERNDMIEHTTTDFTDTELMQLAALLQKILLAVQTDKTTQAAERSAENIA